MDVKEKEIFEELMQLLSKEYLKKGDFLPLFSYYRVHLRELDLPNFKRFDAILKKYQKEFYSRIDEEEVDTYYLEIRDKKEYILYKSMEMHLDYPHCTNSLYLLEDAFVDLVREQITDDVAYFDLLEKLYYLSDVVDEKTFYIMHNILLYYQDIEKSEPSYILNLNALENLYTQVKVEYQKIKNR